MNEFDWVEDIPTDIYDGLKFTISGDTGDTGLTIYTVVFTKVPDWVDITWSNPHGNCKSSNYRKVTVTKYIREGTWVEV